jgi:membrane protease YdiL (CAAX protease family)
MSHLNRGGVALILILTLPFLIYHNTLSRVSWYSIDYFIHLNGELFPYFSLAFHLLTYSALLVFLINKFNISFLNFGLKHIVIGILFSSPFLFFALITYLNETIGHKVYQVFEMHMNRMYGSSTAFLSLMNLVWVFKVVLIEELILRSILQEKLKTKFRAFTRVILVALIAVSLHSLNGFSVAKYILLFFMFLLGGFAYEKTDKLVTPFLVHFINNLRIFIVAPLAFA